MATTVRVEDKVHAMLVELAKEERRPIGQVIEQAIEQYRREKFWKGVTEDLERLRADQLEKLRADAEAGDLLRLADLRQVGVPEVGCRQLVERRDPVLPFQEIGRRHG